MNFDGNFRKLGQCNVSTFAAKVAEISDRVWEAESFRTEVYEVHEDTQTLNLLMDDDYRHRNPTRHPAYDEFEPEVVAIMGQVNRYLRGSLKMRRLVAKHGPGYFICVLLVRLLPDSAIPGHYDTYESLARCHRIHVPLITNDKVIFGVGGSSQHMSAGEIWEINNRHKHSVTNRSEEARVHLILDYIQTGESVIDVDGEELFC